MGLICVIKAQQVLSVVHEWENGKSFGVEKDEGCTYTTGKPTHL